jgi:hypothetical protein
MKKSPQSEREIKTSLGLATNFVEPINFCPALSPTAATIEIQLGLDNGSC